MSIYTKTGDKGTTSLFDNKRVSKDDIRVESYGTVDELVSFLGLAKNYIDEEEIYNIIQEVQNKLFTVASNLATEDKTKVKYHIVEEDIKYLEENIDEYMGRLNNPIGFIVPGSGEKSGYLHVCRTICRRAERRIITLGSYREVDPLVIKYVNRLSDLIYALARYLEEEEIKVEYRA
ncbi:cob(I)yrinic acid a,c-diamide adenosyltransferase [Clostridium sp. Cult1]|jgi:cob(I)alamin adenosyltransferase|uniref:cob(I)yrinic acid a,c-diamide adenosyltransferase n=1 Tax=Clostridium sp. Cult1 TaxID=2079002 RepID=UPI001EFFFA56|nr:cob(I)yrinic acid a,c-diamide adenosyltransferase [Clostridium sp. Cult1]MCF6462243.1 ATP:cob(I)alamin adenosyltransferase [Clostridium sp. Cult1]